MQSVFDRDLLIQLLVGHTPSVLKPINEVEIGGVAS